MLNLLQVVLFLKITLIKSQKLGYNERCNSTEECSDHRYQCQFDNGNVLRCLCDRFHSWFDGYGCVQMYNATEILNMTVTVTDNISDLEEQVEAVMKTQIAAGLFVFAMVVVATITVAIFCTYVHVKDVAPKRSKIEPRFTEIKGGTKASTSASPV